jgi:hypothetical protein
VTRLSVAIVSHGHEAMLPACLGSLAKALDGIDYEVILLDNLGAGHAEPLLRAAFPGGRFVANSEQQGFAANANRVALLASGEYLLLLNPDTEYRCGSIGGALQFLDDNTDVAVLGCRMLYPDGRPQQSCRQFPTLPVIVARGLGADYWPLRPRYYRLRMMEGVPITAPSIVDWVFGAFLLVRRSQFLAIGGMDPKFRLYYEDVDLCYRFRAQGFGTAIFPGLEFFHRHMRSSAARPFGRLWRWHLRSSCRFLRKHRYLFRHGMRQA